MGIDNDAGKFYFDIFLSSGEGLYLNLIPFRTLFQCLFELNMSVSDWEGVALLNISANIFLFSPVGFLIPLIWERWNSIKSLFLLTLSITYLIEFIQFFIGRSSDIDDVI